MGDPRGLDDLSAEAPEFAQLEWNTMVAYPDLDASPTKAWMIYRRKPPRYRCRLGCILLKMAAISFLTGRTILESTASAK